MGSAESVKTPGHNEENGWVKCSGQVWRLSASAKSLTFVSVDLFSYVSLLVAEYINVAFIT